MFAASPIVDQRGAASKITLESTPSIIKYFSQTRTCPPTAMNSSSEASQALASATDSAVACSCCSFSTGSSFSEISTSGILVAVALANNLSFIIAAAMITIFTAVYLSGLARSASKINAGTKATFRVERLGAFLVPVPVSSTATKLARS